MFIWFFWCSPWNHHWIPVEITLWRCPKIEIIHFHGGFLWNKPYKASIITIESPWKSPFFLTKSLNFPSHGRPETRWCPRSMLHRSLGPRMTESSGIKATCIYVRIIYISLSIYIYIYIYICVRVYIYMYMYDIYYIYTVCMYIYYIKGLVQ